MHFFRIYMMLHLFVVVVHLLDPLYILPLNAHLEIKALTTSLDGACIAAVMSLIRIYLCTFIK